VDGEARLLKEHLDVNFSGEDSDGLVLACVYANEGCAEERLTCLVIGVGDGTLADLEAVEKVWAESIKRAGRIEVIGCGKESGSERRFTPVQ
jgi:hypothetical protein